MRLLVTLRADRSKPGWVQLEDADGRVVAGPFPVAGRANDATARKRGNPLRLPTLPYGDTPCGRYRILQLLASGDNTPYPSKLFGRSGVLVLEGISGDAALAEANGRFVVTIHGGPGGSGSALRCTGGSLRVSDDSMSALAEAVTRTNVLRCECIETRNEVWPVGVCEPTIDIASAWEDPDAAVEPLGPDQSPPAPSIQSPWVMPRYVAATTISIVAHGEYDSGPEPGTHTEIVDGMGVQVHDGFHLENVDGHLTEVPDAPEHPEPQPESPGPTPSPEAHPEPGPEPNPQPGPTPGPEPEPPGHEHEPHDPAEPVPAPHPPAPGPPSPSPGMSAVQALLADPNISFGTTHVSGVEDNATAQQNIDDAAAGQPVARSHHGNAPGGTIPGLNMSMLSAIGDLANSFTFRISELAGGSHSVNSAHYNGNAVDFDRIDGSPVSSGNASVPGFMQRCRDLGATVVLGPGDPGHATHVHCQWPWLCKCEP